MFDLNERFFYIYFKIKYKKYKSGSGGKWDFLTNI